MTTQEFLDELYSRVAAGKPHSGLDITLGHLEQLAHESRLGEFDAILAAVDVGRITSSICYCILNACRLVAPHEFPAWQGFFDRAFAEVAKESGERAHAVFDRFLKKDTRPSMSTRDIVNWVQSQGFVIVSTPHCDPP